MAKPKTMNTKPNQLLDRKSNIQDLSAGKGNSRSEGTMAQIEKHPTVSKTARSVFETLKHQAVMSCTAVGVATSLLIASSGAHAMGLGVLDVQSNLDQPLNGLITVNVAPGDDISTLKAEVASREEFEMLGVDYPEYLKDIKLSVERSGQGAVLRVSSNDIIIKEPFIHFLVKVSWSGGNFLREYTALIDPPVYAAESPKSIAKPKEVGTDFSYEDESSQAYEDDSPEIFDSIDEPSVDESAYVEPAETVATQNDLDSEGQDARYGPVAAGESLSLIAQELQRQVPDLSIYAVMKVLFDENPEAFIGGNINGLIKGSILDIGDLNQIRATDVVEAKRFFRDQVAAWDPDLLRSPTESDSGIGVGQDTYTSDSDLFGSTPSFGEDSSSESFQVGASDDTETFVSAAQGDNRDGEVLALRQEITQLQSDLASSELENQELTERISILEGQLADMNRLMSLNVEDADLASLESTLAQQNDAVPGALESAEEQIAEVSDTLDDFLGDEVPQTTDEINDAFSDFLAEDGVNSPEEGELTDGLLIDDQPITDTLGSGIDEVVDDAVEGTQSVIEEIKEPSKPNIVLNTPVKEESLLDKVGGLVPVLGGLGALLAAGVGLFVWRRRRADEEFEISMLSIESNSQSIDIDTESGMSASMTASQSEMDSERPDEDTEGADKETSFLTVYSDSDAVVQADEVDPIAEADVYIAYGRDEQAEEVLLDGIASHPDRIDVKQKLMGLYFKNQNTEGFERIAEELFTQRDEMGAEAWQEISDMGKELVPDNPLFALSGDDFAVVDQAADSAEEAPAADLDDPELTVDPADDGDLLSFDSDDAGSDEKAIDFAETSDLVVDADDDDSSIQLINFDDGRSQISELDEVEIDSLAVEEGDDGALEFAAPSVEEADSHNLEDLEEDDLVLDFDSSSIGSDDDEVAVGEERRVSEVPEVSDLVIDPEYDESQTQYELAKVFVDLGDNDGARKILEELVSNTSNTPELISNAQELLDSMDA